MSILDKLFGGDIDGVLRDMEEEKFKRMAQFAGVFRDTMVEEMRPAVVWWLLRGGTHEPKCGYAEKGDLLRWKDVSFSGKVYRMPTVRVDYLQLIVSGKIEIKGVELCKWIGTKADASTRDVFIALRRSQNKK